MADLTFEFSDLIGFPCYNDGIDFDAIKLTSEMGVEQFQLTVDDHNTQNYVDLPAAQQFGQVLETSQVVEQPVEQTNNQLTELSEVPAQSVEQPPSPQTIENAVLSQFNQSISPEFVSQPVSIMFVDQTTSSQGEEPVTKYLVSTVPIPVNNEINTVCDVDEVKPKKRGRKPKSSTGPVRKSRRQPKVKVYEMQPLDDAEAERKRLNAINAKRHRDIAKQKMADMQCKLDDVVKERDNLKQMVEKLQQNEKILLQKLNQQHQQDVFTFDQTLFE